jgi:hypothetical protein
MCESGVDIAESDRYAFDEAEECDNERERNEEAELERFAAENTEGEEDVRVGGEDWEETLRMMRIGGRIVMVIAPEIA